MTSSPVMLGAAALALALSGGTARRAAGRRRADSSSDGTARRNGLRDEGRRPRPAIRAAVAVAVLGVSVALVVGGAVGIGSGVVAAALAAGVVRRLEPAVARRERTRRAIELPLVLDLLAVCLRAGMPLVLALETVSEALPGPFGRDLAVVAGMQRLGSAPAEAWIGLRADPDLAPVARAVERSAESGSRLAAAFERLAAERRSVLAVEGEARARRAGVIAMAPLGLCFLPAFVSIGIVPIVLSLSEEVLP
jgi:pilus assembly protein TadC